MGQVATFMENLHLSYDEVVNKVPYRNMVIMQKDKLHEVYGDTVKKISGKEMAKRRNRN